MDETVPVAGSIEAWPPAELSAYQHDDHIEDYRDYARTDLRRFGALAYCLTGGGGQAGREPDDKWARAPSLHALRPMVQGLERGGHIVDVGAGFGEPAAGMLLEFEKRLGLTGTRYLATDMESYGNTSVWIDALAFKLTVARVPRIWVDPLHQEDYYSPWSDAYVDQGNWRSLKKRILNCGGDEWDGRDPGFFDRARQALGGEQIGLLLLRHPEISEYPEVFADIIANLMSEAVRTNVPLLITTSTNETSRERIQAAINAFWDAAPDVHARWEVIRWETPPVMHKNASADGSRIIDTLAWAMFPRSS